MNINKILIETLIEILSDFEVLRVYNFDISVLENVIVELDGGN